MTPHPGAKSSNDDEALGIARGAGLNLVGAAFSHGALLCVFVILSRLGADDIGLYAQAFAFLSLLNVLALSGVQAALTRFVAVHLAEGDWGALRGTVRAGLALTTAFALILAAILYGAAPWLSDRAFGDPALLWPLRYAALTLPAATFLDTALAATKGFSTMKANALIGLLLEPALRLGLTLALVVAGNGVIGAMIAMLVSRIVAAALAAIALRRMMGAPAVPPAYRLWTLLGFSGVSWIAGLATTGLVWVDTILIGVFGSSADVGLYNVATRIVVLATFVMVPVNAAFAPRIAALSQRGDLGALDRSYGLTTSWILRLSLPTFILLLVYPHQLLSLFGGPGFAAGAVVTVILAVGKLIEVGTGPCGLMLTMSGRPALVMIDNLVALGLNIGLNIWLIPQYGILGCAAAWAVSLGLVNLARVTQVWLTMRMLPFGAEIAKGLAAGGAAFTIALAVQRTLTGPPALLAGAVTVAVVYLSVLVILGITSEDRVLLRTLALRVLPGRFARRHAALPGVLYRGLRPQTSEPPAPGPETPRRPDLKPLSGLGTTVPRDGRHL